MGERRAGVSFEHTHAFYWMLSDPCGRACCSRGNDTTSERGAPLRGVSCFAIIFHPTCPKGDISARSQTLWQKTARIITSLCSPCKHFASPHAPWRVCAQGYSRRPCAAMQYPLPNSRHRTTLSSLDTLNCRMCPSSAVLRTVGTTHRCVATLGSRFVHSTQAIRLLTY